MECPICLECDDNDFTTLKCNHMFHTKCINIWLHNHNTCPYCRALVKTLNVKIKRKTYELYINPTNIVLDRKNKIKIINYTSIKTLKYNRKKFTIIKKDDDCDTKFNKITMYSKDSLYIFNTIKNYVTQSYV